MYNTPRNLFFKHLWRHYVIINLMKMGLVILIIAIICGVGFYFIFIKDKSESPAPIFNENTTSSPAPVPAQNPITKPATATQKNHSVAIQSFAFDKQSINIKKGDTVVWANNDSAPHTVTGDNGGPNSPTLNKNGTYSFTFNTAGIFPYHCAFHPSMKGTIIVAE